MRFTRFLKEDVVSKALEIPEPQYKKQYDPDIAERYLQTLQIAIQSMREKYKEKNYDPEKDVDNPKLTADEAKLKDLQDKYNKWEEIASADDEASGEDTQEDPTAEPGEEAPPEEGEEEAPPEEGEEEAPPEEGEEEAPKKKKPVKEQSNKLRKIFDVPGRDDPTSLDDPKPKVINPDQKNASIQRKKRERYDDREREWELAKRKNANSRNDEKQKHMNRKMREKFKQETAQRIIQSRIKKPT